MNQLLAFLYSALRGVTQNRVIGRKSAGTGRAELLDGADLRTIAGVYSTAEVDAAFQPIGSYAAASHTHVAANVTDFSEAVDDRVSALLVEGTNITITYNDAANTLTIASTASGGISGSTGATDNAILRADGTGGSTVQTSTVTISDNGAMVVTASTATTVPICAKGAASQTGNLQEWQNSAGTILLTVGSSGWIGVSSASSATFSAYAATLSSGGDVQLKADNSAANTLTIGNNQGGMRLRGIACTVYAFAGTALQITSGAGSGTNGAAAAFQLRAGASTGNATPASILFQTTTAGASGATAQTHRSVIEIDGNTASGETPMLLLDCAKGTLQRVSIGASDSGGTGFKVLRVPN